MSTEVHHHFGFKGETLQNAAEITLNDMILLTQKAFALMQFTGLPDKNGREIYEGDILQFEMKTSAGDIKIQKGIMAWNAQLAQFGVSIDTEDMGLPSHVENKTSERGLPEVIGNIYENPELITMS